jgi:hypothetical protein
LLVFFLFLLRLTHRIAHPSSRLDRDPIFPSPFDGQSVHRTDHCPQTSASKHARKNDIDDMIFSPAPFPCSQPSNVLSQLRDGRPSRSVGGPNIVIR